MFYQLNKGEDYDINGTNLKNWLNTYKVNLTDLTLEDNGEATITNLTDLCYNFSDLQNVNFSNFNMSNVLECYRTFENCVNLRNINGLDLSNCNNFRAMFSRCNNLTTFPIKPANFKNNCTYRWTYGECVNITEDIHDINISNCELLNTFTNLKSSSIYNVYIADSTMEYTFYNLKNCRSITNVTIKNIANRFTFANYINLNNVYNITFSNCNVSNAFANSPNLTDVDNIIFDNIINIEGLFNNTPNLSANSYENIANFLPTADNAKTNLLCTLGLNVAKFTPQSNITLKNLGYLDVDMNFDGIQPYYEIITKMGTTTVAKGDLYDYNGTVLKGFINTSINATTGNNITIIDNSSAIIDTQYLFFSKTLLQNINLLDFDMSNTYYAQKMFANCKNVQNITMPYNITNLVSIESMFEHCSNLTSIPNFNTSNVTVMACAFLNCRNITTIPNFNTSNVTNLRQAFQWCYKLTDVPNIDTSNVTNMYQVFYNCFNLTTVPNFNLTNTLMTNNMFQYCNNLISVLEYNIPNVTGMGKMFSGCNNLSNASIQNIINMCLNSNVPSDMRNLYVNNALSPLYNTIFNTMYYVNRQDELTTAGWTFEPYDEDSGEWT